MIDGLAEDTGSDTSLEAAAAAINGLLSGKPEDKKTREAPRKPTAPAEPAEEDDADTEPADETEQQPAEEEESEEVDDEPTPQESQPRKLKVKVNGQEIEVTEDEAVKGYSRTEDYTRKTQELAEKRKAFEAESEAVRGERQRYATQLAQLEKVLKDATPAEPDWDTLRDGDPAVFAATYAAWKQHQDRIEAISAERTKAEQKVQADRVAKMQDALKAESTKLLEAIPAWKDDAVAKAEKVKVAEYARAQGYTDDELSAVTDHRVIKILRDAMLFRAAQQKKPAIESKIEKARVMAPGSTASPREVSDLTKAKQALAKSHSLKDAGSAIALLLG